jgi:hypothetical protein
MAVATQWGAGTTGALAGRIFQTLLFTATLLPLTLALLPHTPLAVVVLTGLGILAGTHVMATLYLYLSRGNLVGVDAAIVVTTPLLLMATIYAILLLAPLSVCMTVMLVYIHFGIWHFGRQNLGVTAFIARISCQRSISTFERTTITMGIIAGICGAYRTFAPGLMLNPTFFPFDLHLVAPVMSLLWYVGIGIYVALLPVTFIGIYLWRHEYRAISLATHVASTFFFLPMYVSSDSFVAVGSWNIAHGLQYLVFLSFHAAGARARRGPLVAMHILFLLIVVSAGYWVWSEAASFQQLGSPFLAKFAIATLTAITLAHYWVDMFLWRFRSADRREWLIDSFPFLAGKTAPPARAAN